MSIRPYSRLDFQRRTNPKLQLAGTAAAHLHACSLNFAVERRTAGFISDHDVPELWRPVGERFQWGRAKQRLLDNGLWHAVEGGIRINDFAEYNVMPPKAAERREKARLKKRRQRAANATRIAEPDKVMSKSCQSRVKVVSISESDIPVFPQEIGTVPPGTIENVPTENLYKRDRGHAQLLKVSERQRDNTPCQPSSSLDISDDHTQLDPPVALPATASAPPAIVAAAMPDEAPMTWPELERQLQVDRIAAPGAAFKSRDIAPMRKLCVAGHVTWALYRAACDQTLRVASRPGDKVNPGLFASILQREVAQANAPLPPRRVEQARTRASFAEQQCVDVTRAWLDGRSGLPKAGGLQ